MVVVRKVGSVMPKYYVQTERGGDYWQHVISRNRR